MAHGRISLEMLSVLLVIPMVVSTIRPVVRKGFVALLVCAKLAILQLTAVVHVFLALQIHTSKIPVTTNAHSLLRMEVSNIQPLAQVFAKVAITLMTTVSHVLLVIPMDVLVKLPLLQALAKLVTLLSMAELRALNVSPANSRQLPATKLAHHVPLMDVSVAQFFLQAPAVRDITPPIMG
jgi:hypothetical protein